MKIGVIPDSFRLPIREGIRKAAELGFDGIQPYTTRGDLGPRNLSRSGRDDLKGLVAGLGLTISAVVGDFGKGFGKPEIVDENVTLTKEVVDLAVDLGVSIVTTHIGTVPDDPGHVAWKTMAQALPDLGTYAAGKGIVLATETGPESAALLRKFLESVNNPGLKVNYDPANLVMLVADDPVKGVFTLRDYIVHTHAKDGVKLEKGYKELPLGQGGVDFPAYLKALKDIGYAGFFTIEREVGADPAADIVHARDFLRGLAQKLAL